MLVNLAAFEAAHNPDHGAGPGAKLGNPAIDSDPYALRPVPRRLRGRRRGGKRPALDQPGRQVSVLAVFPTQERAPQTARSLRGSAHRPRRRRSRPRLCRAAWPSAPTARSMSASSPACRSRRARHASGGRAGKEDARSTPRGSRTSLISHSLGKNLLVLEMATEGPVRPALAGRADRACTGRHPHVLASAGPRLPDGLAVGNGSIYISNHGLYPGIRRRACTASCSGSQARATPVRRSAATGR